MQKQEKPKSKKDRGEKAVPEALPPPPPSEDAGPPPPRNGDAQPNENQGGKPNKGKGKGKNRGGPSDCPKGMVPLEDGSCVTPQ